MTYRIQIIFIICLFYAQSNVFCKNDRFKRLGVEDGLSQRWVRCIHQDQYGFLWIGTKDGLNKYNSHEFIVYRPSETNPHSICNGTINDIFEQVNGNLLIATDRGISVYNREFDYFTDYKYLKNYSVTCILYTSEKNFWFGTESGLFFYNAQKNELKEFTHKPNNNSSLKDNNIISLFEDSKKNIWIGTQNGLCNFNTSDSTFTKAYGTYADQDLNYLPIFTFAEDKNGNIYVGSSGGGVDIISYNDSTRSYKFNGRILKGNVVSLFIDSRERLFIGRGASGGLWITDLNSLNINQPEYDVFLNKPNNPNSLSDNSIECFLEDNIGDIWIGTYGNGLNLFTDRNIKFNLVDNLEDYNLELSNKLINVIFEEDNYLWIGTEGGLNLIEKSTGKITTFLNDKNNPNSIGASAIYAICKDSFDNLWVGTWNGGLNKYNYNKNNFTQITANRKIGFNHVFKIYQDKQNRLWIGTIGGGLNLYEYSKNSYSPFFDKNSTEKKYSIDYVNDIIQTSDRTIWFSSFSALNKIDINEKTIIQYYYNSDDSESISDGDIITLFEDSKKNLWIGTEGGLNYFDRKNGRFIKYNTQNGLPNNSIKAITEDDHGNLWISTNYGITKFINGTELPEKPKFHNYNKSDGLNSVEYIKRSVLKNKDGIIYFGGINGYTYFHPDSIYDIITQQQVIITDLLISNKKVIPGVNKSILPKEIYLLDELDLSYKHSVFTLKYAALNYLKPENSNYAYKLEGFEKNWNYVGNQQFATYTNLDPGSYIFKIKVKLNSEEWTKEFTSLKINIVPPWWQTIWFKISSLALVGLLIFGFSFIRTYRLKLMQDILKNMVDERTHELSKVNKNLEITQKKISQQNDELSHHRSELEKLVRERTWELELALQKAKESDELKSAFLANISHEIRTPMNAIIGFTTLLNKGKITDENREGYIKLISSNSESLLVLLNDIIDQSLLKSNQVNINILKFDVYEMFEDLENIFIMNNTRGIGVQFTNKTSKEEIIIKNDPLRLKQCLINLLKNAFKYTKKGYIAFGYNIIDNKIVFHVVDTGIGIAPEHHSKIFEQFFKVESEDNAVYRGAGLGLSITKKLVELMNGKIWVDSELGKGAKFYISLPYKKLKADKKNLTKEKSPQKYNFKNYDILVAEDEKVNYLLIKEILKNTEAKIYRAVNGIEAVEFVRKNKNLKNLIILMDIKMPKMNGYKALAEIRRLNPKIPVIAITAYSTEPDKRKIASHGFDLYLSKPFSQNNLLLIVKQSIEKIK